jgi:hypothetical protein
VRPEVRHAAQVVLALPMLLTAAGCCRFVCPVKAPLGDVVSGQPGGSALVKVLVTLSDDRQGVCAATVAPERVVVFPGSAIRWRVVNRCTKPAAPHVQFTQPQPVPRKAAGDPIVPRPWDYRFCTGRIATIYESNDERNVLFCEVPESVVPGVYKYGLDGAAKRDPDIEVRRGG